MDYGLTGNHAIIPANTVTQTARAFTGHEQIKEISGLIHMNARVYDSDIGRFLSADTLIQDPHDSQSYNRYSYARNNPLVFTDPSGHSWLSKLWHHVKKYIRTIASIIVAAVIVAGTMGYGLLAPWLAGMNTIAAGALAGFASGAIMTGSLSGALKGALFGAIGAGLAAGIGHAIPGLKGAGNLFAKGVNVGKLFIKSALHGLSRGIISMAQGGTFKSGFASGFSSSFFSPGTQVGGTGAGGFGLRTSIAAIVGGTASKLGGGKFSNGAVSGAFVHMFNAEANKVDVKDSLKKAYDFYKSLDEVNEHIEMTKNLINLGKALSTNDLNLAAESYASLYEYIPVPVSIVPVKPEAISRAINSIQNYHNRQIDALRSLCGSSSSCYQHYSN